MIITIDGPSGTGKTTVARQVAEKLGFVYFDTGAMYRAFTWLVLQKNIDLHAITAVEKLLSEFDFKIIPHGKERRYYTQGHDVTDVIRSQPVTAHVSAVSALKQVRHALLALQHQFAAERDAVFEGRDLGTVVFPQAEIKIFLDADPQVRAQRRLSEIEKNPQEAALFTPDKMLADLQRRDTYDATRELAPLRCPSDALKIDTTPLSIGEVVDTIIAYVLKKHPALAPR